MPIFKLLIFDFDGTLASSLDGITACFQQTLVHYEYSSPTAAEVRRTIGLTIEESVRRLTRFECREQDIPEIVTFYRALHETVAAPRIQLFEGVREILSDVQSSRIKTALVSNKGSAGLNGLLDKFAIRNRFDLIVSADSSSCQKPAAELYERYISPMFGEIDRSETVLVGDTESDLQFARNSGIRSCWAQYGYGDVSTCDALRPDFRICKIAELRSIVQID